MTENNNKIWATPKILSDSPLRDSDIARFHFDEFAITLARLIADPETRTPLTIGVSGKWGSGKTTLLQRVKKLLDETKGKKNCPLQMKERIFEYAKRSGSMRGRTTMKTSYS